MTQTELSEFFTWVGENLNNFHSQDCEESEHYYLGDDRLGGWRGDTRQYFLDSNDTTAKALRMMDACLHQ